MKKIKFNRNGDVNLHPIEEKDLPKNLKKIECKNGEWILARGEAMGSKHLLTVPRPADLEVFQDERGRFYFNVKTDAKVSHTHDHTTTTLLPGWRVQVDEREKDWFADGIVRKVQD